MASLHETILRRLFDKAGWTTWRNGWPDFLCITPTGFIAIEAKAPNDKLRSQQAWTLSWLACKGVPTYIIRPTGVWRVNPDRSLTRVSWESIGLTEPDGPTPAEARRFKRQVRAQYKVQLTRRQRSALRRKELEDRNRRIYEAATQGSTLGQISRAVGLSRQRCSQIIHKFRPVLPPA